MYLIQQTFQVVFAYILHMVSENFFVTWKAGKAMIGYSLRAVLG